MVSRDLESSADCLTFYTRSTGASKADRRPSFHSGGKLTTVLSLEARFLGGEFD